MCEMSFRPPADDNALARQPSYVAGLMKQWCDTALQHSEHIQVDVFVYLWRNYIKTRLGGEIIYNNACYQAVKAFIGLRSADRSNPGKIENHSYISLAQILLEYVNWAPDTQIDPVAMDGFFHNIANGPYYTDQPMMIGPSHP